MEIEKILSKDAALVNDALADCLKTTDERTALLYEAMRYSAMSGGKRIRPFLVLEFCRLFGGEMRAALPFACAIECVHASSLIHDDMPCMDDDTLRRGKPTNHVVYGEDIALLAGDALITRGYELAARNPCLPPETTLAATAMLLREAGAEGMMGGQQIDLVCEKKKADFDTLLAMHAKKTGALIRASAQLGCYAAGIASETDPRAQDAATYAEGVGLAFQIEDDILDAVGDAALLGKKTHMDDARGKTTFLGFMSVEEAHDYARQVTEKAVSAIKKYDGHEVLTEFALYLLDRKK